MGPEDLKRVRKENRRQENAALLDKGSIEGIWENFFLREFSGNSALCDAILNKRRVPDPTGGTGYKFRVFKDFDVSGRAVLNPSTFLCGPVSLYCWLYTNGGSSPYPAEVVGRFFTALRSYYGVSDDYAAQRASFFEISEEALKAQRERELKNAEKAEFNRRSAALAWNSALTSEQSEPYIRGYLAARGHDYNEVRVPICWRYNPQVPYFAKVYDNRRRESIVKQIGFFGALLALYKDHAGVQSQMHRTFIRPINAGANFIQTPEEDRIKSDSIESLIVDQVRMGKISRRDLEQQLNPSSHAPTSKGFFEALSKRFRLDLEDAEDDWARRQVGWGSPESAGIMIYYGGTSTSRPSVEIVGEGIETMTAVYCAVPEWALPHVMIKALGNTGVLSLYTPRFGTKAVIGVQDYDLKGGGQQTMNTALAKWGADRMVATALVDPALTRENNGVPLILGKKGTDFEDLYLKHKDRAVRAIIEALKAVGIVEPAPTIPADLGTEADLPDVDLNSIPN